MSHRWTLMVAAVLAGSAYCSLAFADPIHSCVRISPEKESTSVSVLGGTRIEIVEAVVRGLGNCERPVERMTVGSWEKFPATVQSGSADNPHLTVWVVDVLENGEKTVCLATTPGHPFPMVWAIAAELRRCGYTNIRLTADSDLSELINVSSGKEVSSASPQ